MIEKKERTYYKNFHKGYTKNKGRGMTEGDIAEALGAITVKVFKSPLEFFGIGDLKEILGECRFYITADQLRKMTREGGLRGRKFCGYFWYFTKQDIYSWVDFLKEVGFRLLIKRKIIFKEERGLGILLKGREKNLGRIGNNKRERVASVNL